MKPSTKRTVRVKGWAVIYDGDYFCSAHRTRRQATAAMLGNLDKIEPCTITYEVPKRKKA